ncbi:hypothetical protein [Maribacter sp.]|uniref:hypothetical protein n=1 Tax=Maribacter sp. TaxID=1897614 RepID=UPI0025BAA7A5|nr:hypothetical protein [Maribacter sp.]
MILQKILKRKNIEQVQTEINELKKAASESFNMNDFNVSETEGCINNLKDLLIYKQAELIMQTNNFKAYADTTKQISFEEFLTTLN